MNILNKAFKYIPSADSAKPGYLHRKWQRLYPGCFRPKKEEPRVVNFKRASR